MDAYSRACAGTQEHSLTALEASHVQPYTKHGPHDVRNGVLLRADLHRLFDQGYVTITPEYRLEVSPWLKEDYRNGRSYYPLHGSSVSVSTAATDAPSVDFLRWHNERVYRACSLQLVLERRLPLSSGRLHSISREDGEDALADSGEHFGRA